MRYTEKVIIDRPIDVVANNLFDPELTLIWMNNIKEVTVLEGEVNQAGGRIERIFLDRRREMRMVENIVEIDLPNRIRTVFETSGVHNECRSRARWSERR